MMRSFPGGSAVKVPFPGGPLLASPSASAGGVSLIPWSERSLREENGNPLQYSCLGNPMGREASWAIVHRAVKGSDTT